MTAPVTALAAATGAIAGLGLAMIAVGLRGHAADAPPVTPWWTAAARRLAILADAGRRRWGDAVAARAAAAVLAFVATGLATRWPVGALLGGLGAWALPGLWRADAAARTDSDTLEAIAVWTEMLRDTLSAAAGLEQAVLATAASAPEALAGPVADLAARISHGEPLASALHTFADDVDDPTADLVVAALVLAATGQARDLTGLLSSLAQAARDQVVLRMRVAVGRARIRTSVRIILVVTLSMVAALVVLDRGYLDAYDSPGGQVVLLVVGALFALAFWWLNRIAAVPVAPRILRRPDPQAGGTPPAPTPRGAR